MREASGGKPPCGDQAGDIVCALGMPGRENELEIRESLAETGVRGEDDLLLARVRASGDPHGRFAEARIAHAEGIGRHLGVELDAAGDLDRVRAEGAEPGCGVLVLAYHAVDAAEHAPCQGTDPAVAPVRPFGKPGVDQVDRSAARRRPFD